MFVVAGVSAQPSSADMHAQLTLATDYVFRGLQQTAHGPAYQGTINYESELGLYAGVWASRVDYARPNDVRSAEIDFFVGYQKRLSPKIAFDLAAVHYAYTGHQVFNYDWTELQATAYLGDAWALTFSAGDNWFGRDDLSYAAELTYRYPLPADVLLDATIGHVKLDHFFEDNYSFGEIGVTKSFGDFTARIAYSTTNSGADQFGGVAKDRWFASVTWTVSS